MIRLEDVLKMSWRRLENVLKTYSQDEYIGLHQDVLKTSSEDVRLKRTYSPWSRRLEDVFWRRRRKTSSRRMFAGIEWCIIRGSINSSVSPLERNIKDLVKFYEIPYGKKLRQQKVSLRKNFVTFFQIMFKLVLTKVGVNISSLAQNFIKFCWRNIYQ